MNKPRRGGIVENKVVPSRGNLRASVHSPMAAQHQPYQDLCLPALLPACPALPLPCMLSLLALPIHPARPALPPCQPCLPFCLKHSSPGRSAACRGAHRGAPAAHGGCPGSRSPALAGQHWGGAVPVLAGMGVLQLGQARCWLCRAAQPARPRWLRSALLACLRCGD